MSTLYRIFGIRPPSVALRMAPPPLSPMETLSSRVLEREYRRVERKESPYSRMFRDAIVREYEDRFEPVERMY